MNKTELKPYWNEDHTKYAILVSKGMECGWVTMNVPELAWDSRVVGYVIDHIKIEGWQDSFDFGKTPWGMTRSTFNERPNIKEFDEFLKSCGYEDIFLSTNVARLQVIWIDAGRRWRIVDGGECQDHLEFEDEIEWTSFD